jgi:hypothetical protein
LIVKWIPTNTFFPDINNGGGRGGGEGGIGIYKFADPPKFEEKSADPTMVLSVLSMKSQSRIRIKLQAKSTI